MKFSKDFVLHVAVLCLAFGRTLATCPETESLSKWSDSSNWPERKPAAGDNVVISTPVLLDESPPDLYNVTINEGGRLVFDPSVKLSLRAANIFVYGEMILGSETCPYEGEVTITLTGTRAEHSGEMNPKGIVVFAGGALEMHGKPKRSWTKLAKSLEPASAAGNIIFDHLGGDSWDETGDEQIRGIAAYVFKQTTSGWKPRSFGVYDISNEDMLRELITMAQSVVDGEVLMMASQKFLRTPAGDSILYEELEKIIYGYVTESLLLREVTDDGTTWALVYEKGNEDSLVEDINPLGTISIANYVNADKIIFNAGSGHFSSGTSKWNNVDAFLVTTFDGAFPLVEVIDDVTTWLPGDRVVFASTDYNFEQVEERVVIECFDCTNKQFRIDANVEQTHFAKVLYGAVDVRGEVGVLNRNIVIQGEMQESCPETNGNCDDDNIEDRDTFGAHVKVLKDFDRVKVEYVELRQVGQHTDAGRYPIHFHMCEGTSGNDYLRGNSIHSTFARCVTIHGTHNVRIVDNICFEHMGHGYFLEDGGEQNNTFDGNLGLITLRGSGSLEPLDSEEPSTFWITNPLNTVINNAAAGGYGHGLWFIFPEQSLSPSDGFMAPGEARSSLMDNVYNNVAHSNRRDGVRVGNRLLEDRTKTFGTKWQPREDPTDLNSAPIWGSFSYHTGYKNGLTNVWVEGGNIHVHHISSADAFGGATLTSEGLFLKFSGRFTNAVILGDTENIGIPFENIGRSVPRENAAHEPHSGIQIWKGPVNFDKIWFADFEPNGFYDNAAIAKRRNSPYQNPFPNIFTNVLTTFTDKPESGPALTKSGDAEHGWRNKDGELGAGWTYVHMDGSIHQIVRSDPVSAAASDCVLRPNWRMARCSTKYGSLRMIGGFDEGATFVLHDTPAAQLTFTMDKAQGPSVVLDGSQTYTVHTPVLSEMVRFVGLGMENGDLLTVGICLPRNAEFSLSSSYSYTRICKNCWTAVDSLAALQANRTGKVYYFDATTGMFYYQMVGFEDRLPGEDNPCANNDCPNIRINILEGDLDDADCRERIYTSEQLTATLDPLPVDDLVIAPTGQSTPPEDYGAGEMKPFTSRAQVNGGFGQWTEWSSCSKSCGDGEQSRRRSCDSPMPEGTGADCAGNWAETRTCQDSSCSINGQFTEWSEWSECQVTGSDTNGHTFRTRSCTDPAPQYNGIHCEGPTYEMEPCSTLVSIMQ